MSTHNISTNPFDEESVQSENDKNDNTSKDVHNRMNANPFEGSHSSHDDASNKNNYDHEDDNVSISGCDSRSKEDDYDDFDSFLSFMSESRTFDHDRSHAHVGSITSMDQDQDSISTVIYEDSLSPLILVEDTSILEQEENTTKRTAPLSFDLKEVKATPALNFQSSDKVSHQKESTSKPALNFENEQVLSSHGNDFISPLESALIDEVQDLKASDNNDNNSNEDDGNIANGQWYGATIISSYGSYFPVSWLPNFLYNSTNNGMKSVEDKTENTVTILEDDMGEGKHKNVSIPLNRPESDLETGLVSTFSKKESILQNGDDFENNPLLEANEVQMRMDKVSADLSRVINYESKRKKRQRAPALDGRILERIDSQSKDMNQAMDHRHSGTPWTRLIILEELGTASSWVVLVLPYVAFVVALILDSGSQLWNHTSDALSTNERCPSSSFETDVPLYPLPDNPCWYEYHLEEKNNGLLSFVERFVDTTESDFEHTMRRGVAITSGPLTNVPALTTYLFADITFDNLSTQSVSLVSEGRVYFSSMLMQKEINESPDGAWFPVFISEPTNLAMVCDSKKDDSTWSCSSPRNLDILFTLPGASILTGGTVRIDTIISFEENLTVASNLTSVMSNITSFATSTKVFLNDKVDVDELSHVDTSHPNRLLLEIAKSSSYYVSYRKAIQTKVLIAVRIGTILFSCFFIIFWLWSMGIDGFFGIKSGACCCLFVRKCHDAKLSNESALSWWENPWILFPERRYLLLMMVSLLLVQNPVMVYMYFHPSLYGSSRMHISADSLIGIGIHGILCLWLCLLHGLRYHTAEMARKRGENQKQQLEVQKSINFLRHSGHPSYSTNKPLSDDVLSYYDEYGDFHGTGTSSTIFRMKHDPCGDHWADFLLPKVFFFFVGVSSVVISAYYRFSEGPSGNSHSMVQSHSIYAASSLLQLLVLFIWVTSIIRAALKTGAALRKEPFLSTRPAQLAFRILMSMIILGATSLVILFSADVYAFIKEWESGSRDETGLNYQNSKDYTLGVRSPVSVDILLRVASYAVRRLPYIGTAASLGSGEILFITVSTLTVAFIFLPSTDFILNFDNHHATMRKENGELIHKENQRRDKRFILTLSRYTHTWRVFPSPIDRRPKPLQKRLNSVEHYEINKNLQLISNRWGSGTIYKDNYVAVFCVEIALWLIECAWQTYYSATEYKTDDFAPGIMNLESVGLILEADIFHEETDTRAFVATNLAPQVDGDSDSIIVVAFRGTVSDTNIKTDFNWRQESLPESFIKGSNDKAEYQIKVTGTSNNDYGSLPTISVIKNNENTTKGLELGANKLLKQAFPCVHCGFLHSYLQVRDQIFDEILKVLQRQIEKAVQRREVDDVLKLPKIYVTGHSLGGALGQLLALDLACNIEITNKIRTDINFHKRAHSYAPVIQSTCSYDEQSVHVEKDLRARCNSFPSKVSYDSPDDDSVDFVHKMLSGMEFDEKKQAKRSLRPPIAMYSFGGPRIGNHAFARFYKSHVPHTFRVVTEGDIITSMPFASCCPEVSRYKHAGLEVALDEKCTGNILVGPTIVETMFRFSKVRTSINAHLLENYRKCIESALTQDELQEVYQNRCSNDHSFRGGFNKSDILPDWYVSTVEKKKRSSVVLSTDWTSNDVGVGAYRDDLPNWAI